MPVCPAASSNHGAGTWGVLCGRYVDPELGWPRCGQQVPDLTVPTCSQGTCPSGPQRSQLSQWCSPAGKLGPWVLPRHARDLTSYLSCPGTPGFLGCLPAAARDPQLQSYARGKHHCGEAQLPWRTSASGRGNSTHQSLFSLTPANYTF